MKQMVGGGSGGGGGDKGRTGAMSEPVLKRVGGSGNKGSTGAMSEPVLFERTADGNVLMKAWQVAELRSAKNRLQECHSVEAGGQAMQVLWDMADRCATPDVAVCTHSGLSWLYANLALQSRRQLHQTEPQTGFQCPSDIGVDPDEVTREQRQLTATLFG